MDYNDYINKMMAILGNGHTFLRLGLGKTHDRIKSIELNFQKPLLNLVKNKVLRWKFMRPSDRWFPYDHDCMVYPKVIKIIFLFIRFLSMLGSVQQVGKNHWRSCHSCWKIIWLICFRNYIQNSPFSTENIANIFICY